MRTSMDMEFVLTDPKTGEKREVETVFLSGGRMRCTCEWTGRHMLISLIATFGVVLAVNGYFIVQAERTYPGQDVHPSLYAGRRLQSDAARIAPKQASARLVGDNRRHAGGRRHGHHHRHR